MINCIDALFEMHENEKALPAYQVFQGEVFVAVKDADDHIGIASKPDIPDDKAIESEYIGRVILQARISALVNHNCICRPYTEVSTVISEKMTAGRIVMAGYIEPLYRKLIQKGLSVDAFDFHKSQPEIMPMSLMSDYLRDAEILLTSGTSLSNGSFGEMNSLLPESAKIYIVGPSVPCSQKLFSLFPRIDGLFGSYVNNHAIIQRITDGYGMRELSSHLQKISLLRSEITFQDMFGLG